MINLKNICVNYKNISVINNLNIEIHEGEFFTLLGPSGCGKTTILRVISGLEKPINGQVIINKKDITNINPENREIGFVFQNYALFPTMSVYENIEFGLKIRRYNKEIIKEMVEKISKLMDISLYLNKNIAELSGGQQQRVAFARALILEPKILLLDEPLSNLDAKLRDTLRKEIKKLQRDLGITTIYVTHDQEEALAISDRIAVINNGKIQQIDTPPNIYNNPKTEFVAKFIGEINYLNKNFIQKINSKFKLNLNINYNYYIRKEHVMISKTNIKNKKGFIIWPAKVGNIEYLGAYIKTTFETEFINIISTSFCTKEPLKYGNKIFILFHIDNLICFENLKDENI